ncbi:MAG: NAD-dependent epimerase/dehydratase family protein [Thermoplasmata archaeon]
MRTLVIGGTEFIGRHTVEELLRRGHEVTIFHRGHSPNPFGDRVRERLGDRLRPRDIRDALAAEQFDAVIDLVYVWGPGTGPREVSAVLDAVQVGLRRYVFLSSCGVYVLGGSVPATEDSPRGPSLGKYSADKIATEDYLLSAQEESRVDVSIVRPPHVYGPYNNVPRESWFWDRIVAGRPVVVPDEGKTLTHLAAVWDVAWALGECSENPAARGEVFNVAHSEPVSEADLVDLLGEAAGRSVEKVFVPRSRIYDLGGSVSSAPLYFAVALDAEVDLAVDISKAIRTLGFRPTEPLDGLRKTFEWYMRADRGRSPKFSFDKMLLGR